MIIRSALFTLALLILPVAAYAQDSSLPQWKILTDKSTLTFSGTQQKAPFDGKFTGFSGTIWFDAMKPETSHAAIKVDMATATTSSTDRDQYIGKDAWFNVDKFPEATYTIESFEKTSTDQYVAHGKLALRDVSMPLTLPFKLTIDKPTADGTVLAYADGETKINRLDYGVGQNEWKDTSMVGADVTVKISITAQKQ